MKRSFVTLLKKKMTRKEFLITFVTLLAGISGLSLYFSHLKQSIHQSDKRTSSRHEVKGGFGNNIYGGRKEKV